MNDVRRISLAAVVLLVALRLGIGWQLLYEGLWKVDTLSSATPWSSKGYLANSQGPLRPFFRNVSGDPDGERLINTKALLADWNAWIDAFCRHYAVENTKVEVDGKEMTFPEYLKLEAKGPEHFSAPLAKLPDGVDFKKLGLQEVISYDPAAKELRISGLAHLLAPEHASLIRQVNDQQGPDYEAYRNALNAAYTKSLKISYYERARAHLLGNPAIANPDTYTKDGEELRETVLYRTMVDRYESKLQSAEMAFERDHLNRIQSDVREKASEVVAPIRAIDQEFKEAAVSLLPLNRLQRGPLPAPWTPLKVVDLMTIAGLTVLGSLLILGLFTRFASVSAAFMIFGFYMAMPPWPGVPEAPGPEHSLIVNKNLVEVFALLALACLPSGRWFGLDSAVSGMLSRRKQSKKKA
ncbi:MAG: DoxX family protein [Planctomycetaceae bacterium]|nr:DoxX family protein [Planctomycetaceae bacterium]